MPKLLLAILAAAGLAVVAPASAADNAPQRTVAPTTAVAANSRDAYQAEIDKADAAYKADRERCDAESGNAKDVCRAEARGRRDVAKAEAEAAYRNTPKARYNARLARADADYAVAKERCDDMKGNQRDVCVKDAKAANTRARADAKVDRVATETRRDESERLASARHEAEEDKRDAEYKAAVERCDAFAHTAKQNCVKQAKARYGKS